MADEQSQTCPVVGFGEMDDNGSFRVYSPSMKRQIGTVSGITKQLLGGPPDMLVVSWQFDEALQRNVGDPALPVAIKQPAALDSGMKRCKAIVARHALRNVFAGGFELMEPESAEKVTPYNHEALADAWLQFRSARTPDEQFMDEITRDLPEGHDFTDVALYANVTGMLGDDGLAQLGLDGSEPPKRKVGIGR